MIERNTPYSKGYRKTRWLMEAGIMIALAQVLSYVTLFELPTGGSVTAGSMVPIIIFSIRWGYRKGLLAGVTYGILQFLLGKKYSFHLVSIFCDYLFAFGFLGLAGILRGSLTKSIFGTVIGIAARFVCHVISGVVVFASYAPEGMSPLRYSLGYNLSFLLPEMIISVALVILIYKPLQRHSPNF